MPSPTVLYVVAAIAIALLFVWVALVWKNVDVAWEATPEERARFAKAPLEGEEDPAEEEDKAAEPPAPAKKKSKKAKPAKEASSETPAPAGDETATAKAATDDDAEASASAEEDKPADT